jgi:hypothetical protein
MPRDRESGNASYGPRWERRRKGLRKRGRWQRCELCGTGEGIQIHHVWYVPRLIRLLWPKYRVPLAGDRSFGWRGYSNVWDSIGGVIRTWWPKWLLADRYFMPLCAPDHNKVTKCHNQTGDEYTVDKCTRWLLGERKWRAWRIKGWLWDLPRLLVPPACALLTAVLLFR